MAVAKRLFLKAYGTFVCYVCGAIALAGVLLGLQLGCMNNSQNSFVDQYCLSDNNMRAVVATVLTVTIWFMWTALVDVICSFRTARLSDGIEEGAYVALGSMDYKYCWRCLKTRWCALILLLVFLAYGPGMLQTVLSALIKTVPVYVKSPSSTAIVFDHTSYYNATDVSMPTADLGTATGLLSLLGQFAVGGNSVRDQAKSSVTTTLLRQGFISVVDIKDGDSSNAIRHSETTATLETTCPPPQYLPGLFTDYINSSTIVLWGPTTEDGLRFAGAYLYELECAEIAQDHLVWHSTVVVCSNCAQYLDDVQPQQILRLTCTTHMTLSIDDIVFTLGTQSIQKLPGTSAAATTVNTGGFAELIVNASGSIEAASYTLTDESTRYTYNIAMLDLFNTFQQGAFNLAAASFLHSKICAAAANSLNLLWTNYGTVSIVDGLPTVSNNNNFTLYDKYVPVYSVVQQAYMSTKVSVAFTVCLVSYVALLCAIGIFYTSRAHINVKSVKENSFFSCVDPQCVQGMIAAGASNCEDAQLDLAFQPNRVMYCSAESATLAANSVPVDRIKIGFLRGPPGVYPLKTTMYH